MFPEVWEVLSVGSDSSGEVAMAVLSSEPVASLRTTASMVTVTVSPSAMSPRSQTTGSPAVAGPQVPWVVVTPTLVISLDSWSEKRTSRAVPGPLLVTSTVQRTASPASTGLVSRTLVTTRSAGGVAVPAVAELLARAGSGVFDEAVAVLEIGPAGAFGATVAVMTTVSS
jgi:hypothetical protein